MAKRVYASGVEALIWHASKDEFDLWLNYWHKLEMLTNWKLKPNSAPAQNGWPKSAYGSKSASGIDCLKE